MKKFLLFLIVIAVVMFTSCDKSKGDDFTYGDYPDSVNKNDEDDYNYVKKDADTVKKDDDSYTSTDNDTVSDPDDDTFILPDEDNFTLPDDDNFTLPDEDDSVLADEDNFSLPDEDNYILPDEDNFTLPDEDSTVTPDNAVPDIDTYVEPVCKNGIVEDGEICEPTIPKQCHTLNSEIYQSGWATCEDDCSGWIMTSCVEYPCSEKPDVPDSLFTDSNCDGIDGNIIESVFVDPVFGSNMNDGTMSLPVATITKGIQIAENTGKKHVLVSGASYSENVVLKTGISVHGGYSGNPNWTRSASFETVIQAGAAGIIAEWVGDFTLSFLTVRSANAVSAGQSSFGMVLKNCENITLSNVKVVAGNGAPGTDGTDGVKGGDGTQGTQGNPGCESSGGFFCDSPCSAPEGGAGGTSPCGANGGKGGTPGKGSSNGYPGENGVGSTDNGGAGDIAGSWDGMCLYYAGLAVHGKDGELGDFGVNGAGGVNLGTVSETGYVPADGGNGTDGEHGQGGGGGGGGCGGTDACNSYGSSGGGGGGGGCGGTAGTKGTGGGGSFALWLYKCTDIVFETVRLESKNGGAGGKGGKGMSGGFGALGGAGGTYGGDGDQDDGGCGGWGGAGGSGGTGGSGGGGGGGPSLSLVKIQSSVEGMYFATYVFGSGGAGGPSNGNVGLSGMAGQYHED